MKRAKSMEKGYESLERQPWYGDVENALQGAKFPMDRSTAEKKLSNVRIGSQDIDRYFGQVNWPVDSAQELMYQVHQALSL